jgi:hypothetical protein
MSLSARSTSYCSSGDINKIGTNKSYCRVRAIRRYTKQHFTFSPWVFYFAFQDGNRKLPTIRTSSKTTMAWLSATKSYFQSPRCYSAHGLVATDHRRCRRREACQCDHVCTNRHTCTNNISHHDSCSNFGIVTTFLYCLRAWK